MSQKAAVLRQRAPARRAPGRAGASYLALAVVALSTACATNRGARVSEAGAPAESRYPEPRRPPPLRSTQDGEIMGANEQAPEDVLEGSLTNQHMAPGWALEDGRLVRDRELRSRAAAEAGAEESAYTVPAEQGECPEEQAPAGARGEPGRAEAAAPAQARAAEPAEKKGEPPNADRALAATVKRVCPPPRPR